ncbi:MAG: asparagine synthetase B family protein, partial [bacterium]
MCGIAGKLNFDFQSPVSPALIKEMTREIHYRGPDDEGVWVSGNIALGQRRLSIIDLSRAGHQPMCNEDGTVWITYNGEIYNFPDLRKDLITKGHRFRSHTDTEVIIHLYEEYGTGCLSFMRGMFAFGLWDDNKKLLFLARDRIGQKPLKYYLDDHSLIFASELKSILKDPRVKREVDLEAVDSFLTYQYVPHSLTGFKGI